MLKRNHTKGRSDNAISSATVSYVGMVLYGEHPSLSNGTEAPAGGETLTRNHTKKAEKGRIKKGMKGMVVCQSGIDPVGSG